MPKPYPREFRDNVVAVARRGRAPLTQIAKHFGTSETCLSNWLKEAGIEVGNRPGLTVKDSQQVRELKRRNRLLEQENEVLRPAPPFGCRSRWRAGCWGLRLRAKTSGCDHECRSGIAMTRTSSIGCGRSTRTTPRWGTGSWRTSWRTPGWSRRRTGTGG